MAKKRKTKTVEKVPAATFEQNQHIGCFSSSVVFTDRYGQAWWIDVADGTARPIKFIR